ncbi:MAG: hypothetical protein GYA33_14705 [Thermogutta sp.]|nr:hypothetical protein [Thermogutta sp.]
MREQTTNLRGRARRFFLKTAVAAAGTGLIRPALPHLIAQEQPDRPQQGDSVQDEVLPTIPLGPHRITRLVAGWNPIGGYSHASPILDRYMRDYFTPERIYDFLCQCIRRGIRTWQFDHEPRSVWAIQKLQESGAEMNFICLHAERPTDPPMKRVIDDTRCIALVHHGGVTDSLFRQGKAQLVRDYVKKAHDHGVLAGVSSHSPDNIRRIADEAWENDLFMTCMYKVTRPREEQLELLGRAIVGEPYLETDPVEMTAVVRTVPKPCLAFKILAAGRKCTGGKGVEEAFAFAFRNIKPGDGVIVGMFPVYSDQVAANAALARKYAAQAASVS